MNNSNTNTVVLSINAIAELIGKEKEEITLPNGRVINGLNWKPSELDDVFTAVNDWRESSGFGRNDCVNIDGGGPGWLICCVSHALHPTWSSITYKQGEEKGTLPLSGVEVRDNGAGDDLSFDVEDKGTYVLVSFRLDKPAIDVVATVNSMVAPAIPSGKPVVISGRGPIAIAASLAEAYAHNVPAVGLFQPGTGNIVSISHSAEHQLGSVIE